MWLALLLLACTPEPVTEDNECDGYPAFESPQVLKLALHFVDTPNDSFEFVVDDQITQDLIKKASDVFTCLNLSFDVVSEEQFSIDTDFNDVIDSIYPDHNIEGALNVYIVEDGSSVGGQLWGLEISYDTYLDSQYLWPKLSHEIGHFLGLYHTHSYSSPGTAGFDEDLAEYVNGDECEIRGDKICDTPADPGPSITHWDYASPEGCEYDVGTCEIIECGQDLNGETYQPDTHNIMSYYTDYYIDSETCRDSFTPGQFAVMKTRLESDRADYLE